MEADFESSCTVQYEDELTMQTTPSLHTTCEDYDNAPPGNTPDNASPASVDDLASDSAAIWTAQLRRNPVQDERANPEGQVFSSPGCLVPWNYERGRMNGLSCLNRNSHCNSTLEPAAPFLPPEYLGPVPQSFAVSTSADLRCCNLPQRGHGHDLRVPSSCTHEYTLGTQASVFHGCEVSPDGLPHKPFACTFVGCRSRFKRQKALERHFLGHLGVRPYVCWVPYCHRTFLRRDNLKAHYSTHGKHGGRNLYVATLDPTSAVFDPEYRGRISPEGWPLDILGPAPLPI